jgi:ubiquinone/menaquinone biosynthesis C-methylase UbiE
MSEEALTHEPVAHTPHTCPWWLGYLLASPVRKLIERPASLVLPLVRPGLRVLELGPGLGFFTLPVAAAIGPEGRLVCVDVQRAMLDRLRRRLAKRSLLERTELRLCSAEDFGLDDLTGQVELALALHVVHETVAPTATVTALARTLAPEGRLLLVEPPGHCSAELFAAENAAAEATGLVRWAHPSVEGRKFVTTWRRPR